MCGYYFTIDSKTGLVTDAIFVGVSDAPFESDDESNTELLLCDFMRGRYFYLSNRT